MEASGWLSQARTSDAGTEEAQRRVRGKSRLRGGRRPEAHLAAHRCATQWLRIGWPTWGGWPVEALWRAAGALFVGNIKSLSPTLPTSALKHDIAVAGAAYNCIFWNEVCHVPIYIETIALYGIVRVETDSERVGWCVPISRGGGTFRSTVSAIKSPFNN